MGCVWVVGFEDDERWRWIDIKIRQDSGVRGVRTWGEKFAASFRACAVKARKKAGEESAWPSLPNPFITLASYVFVWMYVGMYVGCWGEEKGGRGS